MPAAGLKTIIALSFVLAVGFLLVILSCALWKVYYPLLVVATYVLAPVPNWICSHCANPDDFVESSGAAVLDLGRFCTGFLVVMGIALPVLLANSQLINIPAMFMCLFPENAPPSLVFCLLLFSLSLFCVLYKLSASTSWMEHRGGDQSVGWLDGPVK
ncbi:vacuolar protein sorting 55-domain-containing protein [Lasiosphaeria miniovina]|uniref:Vacuolar protein sorting 55-domain-containing protein n=1 Tax=Lasiosphaeria miniovina TaxID=1954250 RepID=A0AA40B5F8_9PEZI|nr:vacuolar protein sorting 55-domain-containing protein [Lasiosphaeria miniovina]KAK0727974.1 vacuolar protein sorting 55-domain-containing protein [Lasiosphaeria miniovina]